MAIQSLTGIAQYAERIWAHDASLWTGSDEAGWLGWLDIVDAQLARSEVFTAFANEVKDRAFSHALLLGEGGSSLGAAVMELTFGKTEGFPKLYVLDSTDPAQILATQSKLDLERTLFIVASKSGATLETNLLKQYFFNLTPDASRFLVITDAGSELEKTAKSGGFWKIFNGVESINGRFSVLSDFGMVPAAAMGVDVPRFLRTAMQMVERCKERDISKNPGVALGMQLGEHARREQDKVTLVASPPIASFGAWLEKLLAESTGKAGKGLIPVDREPLESADVYRHDRVFVYARFTPQPAIAQETAVRDIEHSGYTVIHLDVHDKHDLGGEFFRWEIATVVAASMLEVNPFDQPDVEASKAAAYQLISDFEKSGSFPDERPICEEDGIKLFAGERYASELGDCRNLGAWLTQHLNRLLPDEYFALLAYVQMNEQNDEALQRLRTFVRDERHVATCVGFGPRFLHSTGQAYKGGPNSGVFLQITCDDAEQAPIPGRNLTFSAVKAAQARADLGVMVERNRRVLRVHLPVDVEQGLEKLYRLVTAT